MLADPCAVLAKEWDLELTCHVPILGNIRIKRFSMIVEDGKIKIMLAGGITKTSDNAFELTNTAEVYDFEDSSWIFAD